MTLTRRSQSTLFLLQVHKVRLAPHSRGPWARPTHPPLPSLQALGRVLSRPPGLSLLPLGPRPRPLPALGRLHQPTLCLLLLLGPLPRPLPATGHHHNRTISHLLLPLGHRLQPTRLLPATGRWYFVMAQLVLGRHLRPTSCLHPPCELTCPL